MSLQREGSRHPDSSTQPNACSVDVNCVCGEKVSVRYSSSRPRRELAALFTALSLELLVMSSGGKVFCWEPQHCVHSEEHILETQRCDSLGKALFCVFPSFSMLSFLSSSRKRCAYEKDGQKREVHSCGARWCAYWGIPSHGVLPVSCNWVLQPALQTEEIRYPYPDLQISGQLKCLPGEWFQILRCLIQSVILTIKLEL